MKKQLLFVDDDPFILDALRRQLRRYRSQWDAQFATGGNAALALMVDKAFDIVVSDMRMPEMDGAEFLTEVMQRHPRTVRIVLSGQSERELRFQTLAPAHQYLSKPCDLEALRDVIEYSTKLQDFLPNKQLSAAVCSIATLPTLATSIERLQVELARDEPALDCVSEIVMDDPCLSAEVLQLANSPFFGVPGSTTDVTTAVGELGCELVSQLLKRSAQANQATQWPTGFCPNKLAARSREVASAASRWVLENDGERAVADAARTAGLLHGLGKVVLSISQPDVYAQLLAEAKSSSRPIHEVELAELKTTHAHIGGYLLRLWRLPEAIINAITHQHEPRSSHEVSVLTALQAALTPA